MVSVRAFINLDSLPHCQHCTFIYSKNINKENFKQLEGNSCKCLLLVNI